MITIGIDPGATGAIAMLDDHGALIDLRDMPYADGAVLAPVLTHHLLEHNGPRRAVVERAQSMPGMGVAGAFRYGTSYGVILGALGALSIPYETVRPTEWKRRAGLAGKNKDASRRLACELFPDHSHLFARKKDDGRAEAALVARDGWLQLRREVA